MSDKELEQTVEATLYQPSDATPLSPTVHVRDLLQDARTPYPSRPASPSFASSASRSASRSRSRVKPSTPTTPKGKQPVEDTAEAAEQLASASPDIAKVGEPVSKKTKTTLAATAQDLKSLGLQFLRLIPFLPKDHPLRVKMKQLTAPPVRYIVHWLATHLHSRGVLASNLAYDICVLFWKWVVNLFFREIRPRGAHNIPPNKSAALIFVAAPHSNQFVDPLLLLSEVRLTAGRRISFLIAEASTKRAFVGAAARTMQSSEPPLCAAWFSTDVSV